MASTDLVPAARRDIFVGDIEENRPNSEAVNLKLAGNIRFLLDRLFIQEKFVFPMYFNSATSFDNGLGGAAYITNDAEIEEYYMYIQYTGDSGTSRINAAVYDSVGAFKNNLFGAAGNGVTISGNNGNRVIVGKTGLTSTPSDILTNTGGHTVQTGLLNLTSLTAGDTVIPFIEGNANRARSLTFNLKLKEI